MAGDVPPASGGAQPGLGGTAKPLGRKQGLRAATSRGLIPLIPCPVHRQPGWWRCAGPRGVAAGASVRSPWGALERHGPRAVRVGAYVRNRPLGPVVHAVGLGTPRCVQQVLVRPIAVGEIGTGRLLRRRCRRQVRIAFEDHVVALAIRTGGEPGWSRRGAILIAERHRVLLGLKQFLIAAILIGNAGIAGLDLLQRVRRRAGSNRHGRQHNDAPHAYPRRYCHLVRSLASSTPGHPLEFFAE